MKTKLIRCNICKHWYSPIVRQHCDSCGSTIVRAPEGRRITIDVVHASRPGIVIFSGVQSWRPSGNTFAE